LTTTTTRLGLTAYGARVIFMIDTTSTPTAAAASGHIILDGRDKDIRIPANSYISYVIASGETATAATLYISELT